jgi:hypothetical protein
MSLRVEHWRRVAFLSAGISRPFEISLNVPAHIIRPCVKDSPVTERALIRGFPECVLPVYHLLEFRLLSSSCLIAYTGSQQFSRFLSSIRTEFVFTNFYTLIISFPRFRA